ncbi:molybdopterin molybdotransferase MoeA [Roseivivax sp. CAU 1753]
MTVVAHIEGSGCGCDEVAATGGIIPIDAALARIADTVMPVRQVARIGLDAALGRVLAKPVHARTPVPPFDNAAMDGYAIAVRSLTGDGPWQLAVRSRIAAGQAGRDGVGQGTAAQIFTGAPIPDGADAMVMQEDVRRVDGGIVVRHRVARHAHIRRAGEDMAAGAPVLPAGRRLTTRDIAASAAAGFDTVTVRRRVRVALIVTGDEVSAPGQALQPAAIHDVNTPMLRAALTGPEVALVHVGRGKDQPRDLRHQLAALAPNVDLIVTTGGISVGEEDHVKPALSALGASILFSGVAIKPGKPVSFGRLGATFWLGLPGNPLSAFVTWQLFGMALLGRLAGGTQAPSGRRIAVLEGGLRHKPGRCELRLARITGMDGLGRDVVAVDAATHSGRVSTLPDADGLVLIPAEADSLPTGAMVEFQPFCDR